MEWGGDYRIMVFVWNVDCMNDTRVIVFVWNMDCVG